MFGLIKQIPLALLNFSKSLASMANVPTFTKCIFLNHPCTTRPILIDLNLDEYNPGLGYYLTVINLYKCDGIL